MTSDLDGFPLSLARSIRRCFDLPVRKMSIAMFSPMTLYAPAVSGRYAQLLVAVRELPETVGSSSFRIVCRDPLLRSLLHRCAIISPTFCRPFVLMPLSRAINLLSRPGSAGSFFASPRCSRARLTKWRKLECPRRNVAILRGLAVTFEERIGVDLDHEERKE